MNNRHGYMDQLPNQPQQLTCVESETTKEYVFVTSQ
jgi:hypothetical protein